MRHGFLFPVHDDWRKGRHRDGQAFAQVDGGVVGAQLSGSRPKVEGVALVSALEATEGVFVQVRREATCGSRGRAVQGARPLLLGASGPVGLEAEESQDCRDGDEGPHGLEVDDGL